MPKNCKTMNKICDTAVDYSNSPQGLVSLSVLGRVEFSSDAPINRLQYFFDATAPNDPSRVHPNPLNCHPSTNYGRFIAA